MLLLLLIGSVFWTFQLTYVEERGKYNIMKEFDETTIWTSDKIPLMASYNKGFLSCEFFSLLLCLPSIDIYMLYAGKMQHSLWVVEIMHPNLEVENANSLDVVPAGVIPEQFSFRRIWQGKGAQTAACKVLVYLLTYCYYYYKMVTVGWPNAINILELDYGLDKHLGLSIQRILCFVGFRRLVLESYNVWQNYFVGKSLRGSWD